MSSTPLLGAGIYEFVFGAREQQRDQQLAFWQLLGYEPIEEGTLSAAEAESLYGHSAKLTSVRLAHPGCRSFGTGYVRLQFWSQLRNAGLGDCRPIEPGSRWMGMYTHDLPQLRDSFDNANSRERWNLWISPPADASLVQPPPEVRFDQPFVGLRELLVFGNDFRLAFIQRAGFDRPGFGTFDDSLPYKNTEGSHANVIQPSRSFCSDFYKQLFGFETAPFGEAHDSGDEPPTIAALKLRPDELFRVERIRAAECPTGLLQIYSSYLPGGDSRDLSRPGSGNLCAYSIRPADIQAFGKRLSDLSDGAQTPVLADEFGTASIGFDTADGYAWIATE